MPNPTPAAPFTYRDVTGTFDHKIAALRGRGRHDGHEEKPRLPIATPPAPGTASWCTNAPTTPGRSWTSP